MIFLKWKKYELPPELSQSTELPSESKNQTLLTLNFQYRPNYPPRPNSEWSCPTWRTRGNPISIFLLKKLVGSTCRTLSSPSFSSSPLPISLCSASRRERRHSGQQRPWRGQRGRAARPTMATMASGSNGGDYGERRQWR
jgi:hypothetical protein